jgi:PAS domain S-box-containing protein
MVEMNTDSAERLTAPDVNTGVNILIVDDEPRNLDVLESILQSPDYQLVRAKTAEEALLALIQKEFAAIVLDIQMPGMTGIELAQLIKQRKRTKHIPIIFLTAYFNEDKDVLDGYGVGAVDYLTKPINPQILKSKVNVFVDLFRTTRALAEAITALEHEIAQRQKAEAARARLGAIVESSSDAILSQSLDGIITSWNKGAERMFGYAADEIVGRSNSVLIQAYRVDELAPIHQRIQRGETMESFETACVAKDGRLIDVSVTLSPIREDGGSVVGISAIMRDISERKRLESEILLVSERERCRVAQDLHDGVGQQLAGISCLSDVLKSTLAAQGSPETANAARISKLLDAAVNQTRSLARGLHPVAPERDGLMSALENLALIVTDLFEVPCEFQCPEPVLIEDSSVATHLYRIAQEAATNAVKHGQPERIVIRLSLKPESIILTVSDDGLGFDKNASRRDGLGLRIMDYRGSMIGGTVAHQNKAGGGTDVVCTVHRPGSKEPEREEDQTDANAQRTKESIHCR